MEKPLERPAPLPIAVETRPKRKRAVWRLLKSPTAVIGLAILLFWVVLAVIGPAIVPYGINDSESGAVWKPPSEKHLLGTDGLGRDLFSRLVIGARVMVTLPPLAVGLAVLFGTSVGLITGYRGGWFDEILMRLMDIMMAFPVVMLYLIIIVAVGASAINVVFAIAIVTAPAVARLARGLVLDLRNREFIAAARMRGESTAYILFQEIMPNAAGPILVDGLVRIGYATFAIGALGFLGLGVPPPNPDWGRMASEARQAIILTPSAALFPSLAIASVVVGCNLLADSLREVARAEE
jgi:peptide/nickel transport system permease protein